MKRLSAALALAVCTVVLVVLVALVALMELFRQGGGDLFGGLLGGDLFGGLLGDFEGWYTTASASTACAITAPEGGLEADEAVFEGFNATQLGHAATIAEVAAGEGLTRQAVVVALATAIQESGIRNLANTSVPESLDLPNDGRGSDHDSVGIFQQRPSMGWGSVEEIMTPAYSAGKFFEKLQTVSGWESMSVAEAAQAVQVSAFPDAYADHEGEAAAIAEWLAGAGYTCGEGPGIVTAEGWTHPLPGAELTSGFRTADRPTHNGVDFGAEKGTPIYAAADGTLRFSGCEIQDGGSCDVDGSLASSGCGWYVQILHEGGVLTQYCHLESESPLRSNEGVQAGDVIGYVGASGRSSGPHLHFAIHTGASGHSPGDPVPPVEFMSAVGVDLTGDGE